MPDRAHPSSENIPGGGNDVKRESARGFQNKEWLESKIETCLESLHNFCALHSRISLRHTFDVSIVERSKTEGGKYFYSENRKQEKREDAARFLVT